MYFSWLFWCEKQRGKALFDRCMDSSKKLRSSYKEMTCIIQSPVWGDTEDPRGRRMNTAQGLVPESHLRLVHLPVWLRSLLSKQRPFPPLLQYIFWRVFIKTFLMWSRICDLSKNRQGSSIEICWDLLSHLFLCQSLQRLICQLLLLKLRVGSLCRLQI